MISLTLGRCWMAEVRGFAGTRWAGSTMWQAFGWCVRDFCLRLRRCRAYPGEETNRVDC